MFKPLEVYAEGRSEHQRHGRRVSSLINLPVKDEEMNVQPTQPQLRTGQSTGFRLIHILMPPVHEKADCHGHDRCFDASTTRAPKTLQALAVVSVKVDVSVTYEGPTGSTLIVQGPVVRLRFNSETRN